MAEKRTGTYGKYYGNQFTSSQPLTGEEMYANANYIYKVLTEKGWSKNAICAMLGNMQAESSINPGRWQSDDVGNTSLGYGLVQWTPATKYFAWIESSDYNNLSTINAKTKDPSDMDVNLSRILYEVENGIQWIPTSNHHYTFKEFTTSDKSVVELAKAFLLNYERPADQSESVQAYRASNAEQWYSVVTGQVEQPETPVTQTKKRKGFNFVVFNRRRRMSQWTGKPF